MGCSELYWIDCPICGKEFNEYADYLRHWTSYSLWRRLRFFIFHDKLATNLEWREQIRKGAKRDG